MNNCKITGKCPSESKKWSFSAIAVSGGKPPAPTNSNKDQNHMGSSQMDFPAQKPARFVKQPIKREAWPCCSHQVVDNSTSVLSNSVIYSNTDILDQILWWDTQSCLEQNWEGEPVGRFICSTELEICALRTHCIFTCLTCPSGKNNFFENKLLREFAFLDNSSWGQSLHLL